jgi:hypothetical protein
MQFVNFEALIEVLLNIKCCGIVPVPTRQVVPDISKDSSAFLFRA